LPASGLFAALVAAVPLIMWGLEGAKARK